MTLSVTAPSGATHQMADAWRRQTSLRRLYTAIGVGLLITALGSTMWFADEANAGHFFDRLPHLLDFLSWLVPKDWNDVWRAMFDIASPHDTGTQEFNFPLGRSYVWGSFYIPEYFELMLTTLNVALVSTFIGFVFAVPFSFIAARNLTPHPVLRLIVKRLMELLRAFPEIVIAGLFAAIVSIGPIAAIIAIGLHSIGALGKLFYEINENIDMRAEEGLRAVGANWFERVRFAGLPQVLPNFMSYTL
ncbi:ABC transporter permease, partial [Mesorhizobium sp. M7A.F.Ca.CA.001.08.2.1]